MLPRPHDSVPSALGLNTVLSAACLVLAVVLPALVAYSVATSPAQVLAEGLGLPMSSPLRSPGFAMAVSQRAVILVITLVPVGCMAAALLQARYCFRSFVRREYFTLDVVRGLRGFARAIFFSALTSLLVAPFASLLLSAIDGDAHLSLTLNLGSNQLLLLLFAGMVWQIAAVMTKAVVLAEEHSQFI